MQRQRFALITAAALAAGACGGNPPPLPVLGSGGDIEQLVGTWTGEYTSLETRRSGRIYFRLEAGAETATGDVLMVPAEGHDHPEGKHPPSEYIPIEFVRVEGGRIQGTLDIYRDPVCGCRVETTFEGRLRDDTISGTYSSRHLETGRVQRGEWYAIRTANAR